VVAARAFGADGADAQDRLEKLAWEGAAGRYQRGLPDNVGTQLRHELNLIERMEYAPYFLTVESIVRFARSKGILCQGRGSAANSAVRYALSVASIDPVRQGLLLERFVSEERREPPASQIDARTCATIDQHAAPSFPVSRRLRADPESPG
jgi:error-prone DNA polymerase